MAEGGEGCHHFSPLEEQLMREAEEEEVGEEVQIQREKEMASQKLWCAFQDSATAVAHLFRDCQQQAGLSAWVPFQDSASAVTQLYKGSLDVCRQCVECGVKHGQRKRTREIVTWLKRKRRLIRRDELLAFLLDKPYTPPDTAHHPHHQQQHPYFASDQFGNLSDDSPHHFPPPPPPALPPHSVPHLPRPLPCIDGLNFSTPVPMASLPIPMSSSGPCFSNGHSTPRGRWALFGRDEQGVQNDGEVYGTRDGGGGSGSGRKRLNSSSAVAGNFEFSQDSPPLAKRMKI